MSQLLPFRVGEETYALELVAVQEIVENRPVFAFPGAPDVVLGAIGFHGRIVPVVNLPRFLNFDEGKICDRIIVLVKEFGPMALAVDQIKPIVNVELSRAARMNQEREGLYIRDTINWQDDVISLFDLDQLREALEGLCSEHGG